MIGLPLDKEPIVLIKRGRKREISGREISPEDHHADTVISDLRLHNHNEINLVV